MWLRRLIKKTYLTKLEHRLLYNKDKYWSKQCKDKILKALLKLFRKKVFSITNFNSLFVFEPGDIIFPVHFRIKLHSNCTRHKEK